MDTQPAATLPTHTTVVGAWTAWMRHPDGWWYGTDGTQHTHHYIDQRVADGARIVLPEHAEI